MRVLDIFVRRRKETEGRESAEKGQYIQFIPIYGEYHPVRDI